MTAKVKPIQDGFHSVTPYLTVNGAAQAIDFYKKAFGAKERFRMPSPDGKTIGHAEIVIGNSILMLADEFCEFSKSPKTLNGTAVGLMIYVEDVDAVFKHAVEAGATVKSPLNNQFYGDRSATIVDPFGHIWTVATHVEDVPPAEMDKRMKEFCAKMGEKKPGA